MGVHECTRCNRCISPKAPVTTNYNFTTGEDLQSKDDSTLFHRSAKAKLQSTFCPEPPGDTISRKGIIDSIVLGCIPVLFEPQQLVIYEGFFTKDEIASMTVYVSEAEVLGDVFEVSKRMSQWAKASNQTPSKGRKGLTPVLRDVSDKEIINKQLAIATLVPRLIIGLDDTERDAVRFLLDLVKSHAHDTERKRRVSSAFDFV